MDGRYRSLSHCVTYFYYSVYVAVPLRCFCQFILCFLSLSHYVRSVYVVDLVLLCVFAGSFCLCCCFLIVFLSVHLLIFALSFYLCCFLILFIFIFSLSFCLCCCFLILFMFVLVYVCLCASWDSISRLKIHYCTKTIVFPHYCGKMNFNVSFENLNTDFIYAPPGS